MVAPSIWGAAGVRGAGRAAWGGSRPGGVGRWVGCTAEDQDGAQPWLLSPPPSLPSRLSLQTPLHRPQVAPPHSEADLCCPTRALSLPEILCTFPPGLQTPIRSSHLLPPKALSVGVRCCSLLSGRKSRTGSAIQLLGTQANFLISLGLSFSLGGMGTIMATLPTPWGCWENQVKND